MIKRLKRLFLLIFFSAFAYFFIQYGFDQTDPNPMFGDNLDRNQIELAKSKRHKNFFSSHEKSGISVESVEEEVETTTVNKFEDKILRDFFEKTNSDIKVKKNPTEESVSKVPVRDKKVQVNPEKANNFLTKPQKKVKKAELQQIPDVKELEIIETETDIPKKNPTAVAKPKDIQPEISTNKSFHVENEIKIVPARAAEIKVSGPRKKELGEYGKAVILPSELTDDVKELVNYGWNKYQFNEYVSSLISLKRKLLDFRSDYCHDIHNTYGRKLPPVSVIIVFYNEAWSTLLRTIHSIVNRSPPKLIQEIILVDDCSDLPHLKDKLSEYLRENFSQVQLVRNSRREGLIRSRNTGAEIAKSDILVFLDSHIECTSGWLEPLVDRIARNKTTLAVPIIEQIKDDTFELLPRNHTTVALGGFGWDLQFRWFLKKSTDRKHPEAPIDTPTIAGGLFAISASFFKHVGMYDPGLELWGAENLEISFKTWMCGGQIQLIPCSHVGHVFRKKTPYQWPKDSNVFRRNNLRVANVWMDDYVKFYKYATGFDETDYGDVTERMRLRENLNCKNFEWYLTHVYPKRSIPSEQISYGQIRFVGNNESLCLSGTGDKTNSFVSVFGCNSKFS